jgi:hypothetical protein
LDLLLTAFDRLGLRFILECGVGGVFSIRSRTASRELSGVFGMANDPETVSAAPVYQISTREAQVLADLSGIKLDLQ